MNEQITAKELIDMVVECRYTSHLAQLFKEKLASAPPDMSLDTPTMREIRSYSESKGLTFREGFNAFFAEIYAANGNILKNVTDKMLTLLEECLKAGENGTDTEGALDKAIRKFEQQVEKLSELRASIQDNTEEKESLDQAIAQFQEVIRLMREVIFYKNLRKATISVLSAIDEKKKFLEEGEENFLAEIESHCEEISEIDTIKTVGRPPKESFLAEIENGCKKKPGDHNHIIGDHIKIGPNKKPDLLKPAPVAKDKRRRATTIGMMATGIMIMIVAIVAAICALVVPSAAKMLTVIACVCEVLAIIVAIAMFAYEKKQDKANKNK